MNNEVLFYYLNPSFTVAAIFPQKCNKPLKQDQSIQD